MKYLIAVLLGLLITVITWNIRSVDSKPAVFNQNLGPISSSIDRTGWPFGYIEQASNYYPSIQNDIYWDKLTYDLIIWSVVSFVALELFKKKYNHIKKN